MEKVYLVQVTTGMYGEGATWTDKALTTLQKAMDYIESKYEVREKEVLSEGDIYYDIVYDNEWDDVTSAYICIQDVE